MLPVLRNILAPLATALVALPAWAGISMEPFPDASNYSLIVVEDATFGSGAHIDGGFYVGGELTFSDDLIVGGHLPEGSTGLVAKGTITPNSKNIHLQTKDYYAPDGSDSLFKNAGNQLSSNPVSAEDINRLADKSLELSKLASAGVTLSHKEDKNTKLTLTSGELNVLNLDDTTAGYLNKPNATLFFEGFSSDTYLLVNYNLSSDFSFGAKFTSLSDTLNDEELYSHILWNFTGSGDLTLTNDVSVFQGSILAPQTLVNVQTGNDINGQLVAKNLVWTNQGESHDHSPWSKSEEPTPVPVPPVVWLFSIGLALIWRQHAKPSH